MHCWGYTYMFRFVALSVLTVISIAVYIPEDPLCDSGGAGN